MQPNEAVPIPTLTFFRIFVLRTISRNIVYLLGHPLFLPLWGNCRISCKLQILCPDLRKYPPIFASAEATCKERPTRALCVIESTTQHQHRQRNLRDIPRAGKRPISCMTPQRRMSEPSRGCICRMRSHFPPHATMTSVALELPAGTGRAVPRPRANSVSPRPDAVPRHQHPLGKSIVWAVAFFKNHL